MASKLVLEIRPVDTFMFRDGRPFNQDDPGMPEAVSVFPPYPYTVAGMVRALLGKRSHLSISAPLICRDGKPVFPVPRLILKRKDKEFVRLLPGPGIETDLGETNRLPQPDLTRGECGDGLKEIEDCWITKDGLQKVLNDGSPDEGDFVFSKDLWQSEPRVGVGIDNIQDGSRATRSNLGIRRPLDGALYAAAHTRLAKDVSLRVEVEALDGNDIAFDRALGPAGGEHRLAEFSTGACLELPHAPLLAPENGIIRFTIYHLSPCFLHPMPKPNGFFGLKPVNRETKEKNTVKTEALKEANVVSACLGKALMIGGWSFGKERNGSKDREKGPIAMRPAIPPGSVWFLQIPGDRNTAAQIQALHGRRIGEGLGRGFGQIFIGKWTESKNS